MLPKWEGVLIWGMSLVPQLKETGRVQQQNSTLLMWQMLALKMFAFLWTSSALELLVVMLGIAQMQTPALQEHAPIML